MIGYLEGVMKWQSENKMLINVNGVGYMVEVSSLFAKPQKGEKISLYVYTYVREDAIDLYGFEKIAERKLFETLISVSRVGPKAGMNVLSTLTYDEFVNAILGEKIEILKEVSGIGPKTAQRLILELESKIDELAQESEITTSDTSQTVRDDELYEALNSLGYSNQEVDKAVSNLQFDQTASLQDKIKQVLSYLGKESV